MSSDVHYHRGPGRLSGLWALLCVLAILGMLPMFRFVFFMMVIAIAYPDPAAIILWIVIIAYVVLMGFMSYKAFRLIFCRYRLRVTDQGVWVDDARRAWPDSREDLRVVVARRGPWSVARAVWHRKKSQERLRVLDVTAWNWDGDRARGTVEKQLDQFWEACCTAQGKDPSVREEASEGTNGASATSPG